MFSLLNKTKVKELMQDEPKAQRIYEAFNEDNWASLELEQVQDIYEILDNHFDDMKSRLRQVILEKSKANKS